MNPVVNYITRSKEYIITCSNLFQLAEIKLNHSLKDNTIAFPLDEIQGDLNKRDCIVLDIDETVLSTFMFIEKQYKDKTRDYYRYDLEGWNQYILENDLEVIEGVEDFLKSCVERNIKVFFVSNRSVILEEATKRNLNSVLSDIDYEFLFFNPDKRKRRSKKDRYSRINKSYNIRLIIGDLVKDFTVPKEDREGLDRKEFMNKYKDKIRNNWIQLINPLFGSWNNQRYVNHIEY